MYETIAWAKASKDAAFETIKIKRNEAGDDDVDFEVKYCGVCHSDIHQAENDYNNTNYPCVPGHELAGIVTKVGKNVKKLKVGDKVGVGCISDSCMKCRPCLKGDEHFCENTFSWTYNSETVHKHLATDSGYTFGGYSGRLTVHERYAVKIPDAYPLEYAGPVFCAGVTTYSPLKHWGADKGGMRVGVIGIGGLGQMGIRLAKAMGNEVTAISTSPRKKDVAMSIGASNFVVSMDKESMARAAKSLDLILNTVSADHQAATYLPLLAVDGTLVQIGMVLKPHEIYAAPIIWSRLSLSGSLIGGMADTQEVIDFCQKHDIKPEIEMITSQDLDKVFTALKGKNDSIKRYVLDVEKSMKE